jgi:hypothetical protein
MTQEEISKNFKEKFKNINGVNGFHDFFPYENEIGFSIQKDLNKKDINNTSLLSFYIHNNSPESDSKKSILISATYGKKVQNGVSIRNEIKSFTPIDLSSEGDYYYNAIDNKLLKKEKEISPTDIVNEIYEDHIKSTRVFKGFWIRTKIFFWRKLVSGFFKLISSMLHWLLYIISGDKYSYEPIWKTEVLNGVKMNSKLNGMLGIEKKKFKEDLIESIKFDFLGYKASFWLITFYSIFHLLVYIFCYYQNYKPSIILQIFENNFLTLIYVIISFWFLEKIIPTTLKFLIKFNSEKSSYFSYKKIKI